MTISRYFIRRKWWLGLFLLSLMPTVCAAEGVQLFINNLWVSYPGPNCNRDPDSQGRFLCKAPVDNANSRPNLSVSDGGNISNNPHIEFDQQVPSGCTANTNIPNGSAFTNICSTGTYLCANLGFTNDEAPAADVGIDKMEFQIFKFGNGTNPLDPASAPPLRTLSVNNPGVMPGGTTGLLPSATSGYCVLWDGSINILGDTGKSNGTYGFRATVQTNQSGASGPINIEQTRAYPAGTTLDANGNIVMQQPITIDVVDVHVLRTTATIVGSVTGVAAEPYNIIYRLSKDATAYVAVYDASGSLFTPVRQVVFGLPRIGEGIPDGSIQNGDAWNGRADNGDLVRPGVYLAAVTAHAADQYGLDVSTMLTRQIGLDPLQITDILVQPLGGLATSLATLTYTLTEPAQVYVDVYPPGVQFCRGLNNVNDSTVIPDGVETSSVPAKDFGASLGGCAGVVPSVPAFPLRRWVEQKVYRQPVLTFWDGRDRDGNVLPDGDYVFVMYAALPSQNGFTYTPTGEKRIWTSIAKSGFWAINRGYVGISQIVPATTVIGSSPSVSGLGPFNFSYSLSRNAIVTLKVYDASGLNIVKTLVNREVRPGGVTNREIWPDGIGDNGLFVSSGTYLAELSVADQFFPAKVTTTTAVFPINLFRITDVQTTSLLTGATDVATISYQLSYGMNVAWNIYPLGTAIIDSTTTWPPCGILLPGSSCGQIVNNAGQPVAPVITVNGMRPGRLRITEFWDGRGSDGVFVQDGTYLFTLVAQSTTNPRYFAPDKIIGTLTVARGAVVFSQFRITPTVPNLYNSSQTITLPPFDISYSLTRQSSVTVSVLNTQVGAQTVRTLISGQFREAGVLNQDFWDARDDRGNFVSPGFYTVRIIASDLASQLSSGSTVQQTIAVDPLRIYDVAVAPLQGGSGPAQIAYQISETMKVSVKIYRPGTSFDLNTGLPIPPESVSLVRRIVGMRPARTQITEIWDGKDERLSLVPDGGYIFKIIASTDSKAIDSNTGDWDQATNLADDQIVAEVPVVRGESLDPQADFEGNTFVYPNPVKGASTKINVYLPFQSDVFVKIFNIAGELVFEQTFLDIAPSVSASDCTPPIPDHSSCLVKFDWTRVNSAGRGVAPGVYFMMVRESETRGGGNVLQTVKKILLQ